MAAVGRKRRRRRRRRRRRMRRRFEVILFICRKNLYVCIPV
jgi:hypothetical protein